VKDVIMFGVQGLKIKKNLKHALLVIVHIGTLQEDRKKKI
jgi:hypothetical protein